jgi:hypothetical protein
MRGPENTQEPSLSGRGAIEAIGLCRDLTGDLDSKTLVSMNDMAGRTGLFSSDHVMAYAMAFSGFSALT